MEPLILKSQRLALEPLRPDHADSLFAGLSDPRIYEFIEEKPPQSKEALRARYERLCVGRSPDGKETWLNWAIRLQAEDRYVGYMQATVMPENKALIAYVLFPTEWGKGYVSEALLPILRVLYGMHGVREFIATVDERNGRSIKLLETYAFAPAGRKGNELTYILRVDVPEESVLMRVSKVAFPFSVAGLIISIVTMMGDLSKAPFTGVLGLLSLAGTILFGIIILKAPEGNPVPDPGIGSVTGYTGHY